MTENGSGVLFKFPITSRVCFKVWVAFNEYVILEGGGGLLFCLSFNVLGIMRVRVFAYIS